MKTKMVHSLMMSAVFLLIVVSCKKSQVSTQDDAPAVSSASGKSPGEMHNQILNNMATQPGFPSITQQDAFAVAANYLKLHNGSVVTASEMNDSYSARIKNASPQTSADMFGTYSSRVFGALYSSVTPAEFAAKAVAIETEMLADKKLSQTEQIVYHGSLSVLKSSFAYWSDAYTNTRHPWHSTIMKYVSQQNTQGREQVVAGSCLSQFNPSDPSGFLLCVTIVDAINYSDAYWYIYNGSNHAYASQQANAQASYASGVAMGLGMIVHEQ